jgi:hypothetical protein
MQQKGYCQMLSVNIIEDEELQNSLKVFISGLLPHENYDDTFFSDTLQLVFKYIHLDEMSMEYYVLFKVFKDLNSIKSASLNYAPKLMRDTFSDILENSIGDVILEPRLGVKAWLDYEHLESNLAIESVRQDACQKVYTRCMDLYDECFDMKIKSCELLNYVPSLKAAFIAHIGTQTLQTQAKIISGSYRLGSKSYTGFEDWLSYTGHAVSELNERLSDAMSDNIICVDSLDTADTLLRDVKSRFIPIAKYGIPEIDGADGFTGTPMLRHRLVVVVGNENIGKTMFAKDMAVNIILSGHRVVYMCGENVKNKMFCELLVNYIYKKYKYFILPSHINDIDNCPEHIRKVIHMAAIELADSHNLVLRDSYSYDNLYTEMQADYEKYHADAFIIDHSFALTGGYSGDNGKRNIDTLSRDIKSFRKDYPVYCMVLSHPSIPAKDALAGDKTIEYSPTKGSQNLSTDADDLFVLRDNEVLRKENLIAIENTKRRDADRIHDKIILKKMFNVSHFEYDEVYQSTSTSLSVDADMAFKKLDEIYGEDDSLYQL